MHFEKRGNGQCGYNKHWPELFSFPKKRNSVLKKFHMKQPEFILIYRQKCLDCGNEQFKSDQDKVGACPACGGAKATIEIIRIPKSGNKD